MLTMRRCAYSRSEMATATSRETPRGASSDTCNCSRSPRPFSEIGTLLNTVVAVTATNAAESLLSRTRHVKRNVKRWRGGQMMLRWVAAGVLEAVKGFRRLKGCGDMPRLVTALRARDQRLRLGVSEENVA